MAKRTQTVGKSKGKNKTKMKVYNTREARRIARKNGWVLVRRTDDHYHYKKEGHDKILTISGDLNRMVFERCVRDFDLDLNV